MKYFIDTYEFEDDEPKPAKIKENFDLEEVEKIHNELKNKNRRGYEESIELLKSLENRKNNNPKENIIQKDIVIDDIITRADLDRISNEYYSQFIPKLSVSDIVTLDDLQRISDEYYSQFKPKPEQLAKIKELERKVEENENEIPIKKDTVIDDIITRADLDRISNEYYSQFEPKDIMTKELLQKISNEYYSQFQPKEPKDIMTNELLQKISDEYYSQFEPKDVMTKELQLIQRESNRKKRKIPRITDREDDYDYDNEDLLSELSEEEGNSFEFSFLMDEINKINDSLNDLIIKLNEANVTVRQNFTDINEILRDHEERLDELVLLSKYQNHPQVMKDYDDIKSVINEIGKEFDTTDPYQQKLNNEYAEEQIKVAQDFASDFINVNNLKIFDRYSIENSLLMLPEYNNVILQGIEALNKNLKKHEKNILHKIDTEGNKTILYNLGFTLVAIQDMIEENDNLYYEVKVRKNVDMTGSGGNYYPGYNYDPYYSRFINGKFM